MGIGRRTLIVGAAAVAGGAAMRWAGGRNPSLTRAGVMVPNGGDDVLNDASLMSETPVGRHATVVVRGVPQPGDLVRAEIDRAARAGQPLSVGAARHSMGGQALPPRGGHAMTLGGGLIHADAATMTCRVAAGTRWNEVIAALDPLDLSPKVMQSNNDFGVAATFSVNAHGWPVPHGPMGATAREVTMVLPSGETVTCSRQMEPDLFRLAMGGYGLVGIITELTVEIMPNRRLVPRFQRVDAKGFAAEMMKAVARPDVPMAYGRLDVSRTGFFDDALLIAYEETADQANLPPAPGSGWVSRRSRDIFRAQLGSDPVKSARWWVETKLGPAIAGETTRNALLNEPVATLDDRDPARTDILHEYFVEPARFADFLDLCRKVIPGSYQELLNITLRYVKADDESVLAFAPRTDRIAAVMLFSQEMTVRAEADMARMTRDLIDGVIGMGGTYYLPYRPHATPEQFLAAYPRAPEFAALKRAIDPGLWLRNQFWDTYMAKL